MLQKHSDNRFVMIDVTMVWARQQAAGGKEVAMTALCGVSESARVAIVGTQPDKGESTDSRRLLDRGVRLVTSSA